MVDPDVKLMLRFKEGNESAFRILFDKYKKKLVNFTYRFTNDRKTAEELAQEVFLRVYQAAPSYSPDARFSTWLFRIATNICLNESRRHRHELKTESLDASVDTDGHEIIKEVQDDSVQAPAEVLEEREMNIKLREAIMSLPEKQRAVILLHTYQGFSYREIGDQIGSSDSAVKSIIYRARQALITALGPYVRGS